MDDEDEVRDLNLSSRPLREERRRTRERGRLERGMARSHYPAEQHSQSDMSTAPAAWTTAQRQTSSPSRNSRRAKAAIEESSSLRIDGDHRSNPTSNTLCAVNMKTPMAVHSWQVSNVLIHDNFGQ